MIISDTSEPLCQSPPSSLLFPCILPLFSGQEIFCAPRSHHMSGDIPLPDIFSPISSATRPVFYFILFYFLFPLLFLYLEDKSGRLSLRSLLSCRPLFFTHPLFCPSLPDSLTSFHSFSSHHLSSSQCLPHYPPPPLPLCRLLPTSP